MSSILVTGGAGYIGSHAVKVLRAAGRRRRRLRQPRGRPSRGHGARDRRRRGGHPRHRAAPRRHPRASRRRGDALCRLALGRRVGARSGRLLPEQRRRRAVGARRDGGRERAVLRLFLDGRRVRQSRGDADHGVASEAADQRVRRNEAGDRARAAALRDGLRDPIDRAALLQCRRGRSGRGARRGPLAGDPRHPARDRRRPGARSLPGVRRRLRHAGRHVPARLRARQRPGGRARRSRSAALRGGAASTQSTTSATAGRPRSRTSSTRSNG